MTIQEMLVDHGDPPQGGQPRLLVALVIHELVEVAQSPEEVPHDALSFNLHLHCVLEAPARSFLRHPKMPQEPAPHVRLEAGRVTLHGLREPLADEQACTPLRPPTSASLPLPDSSLPSA